MIFYTYNMWMSVKIVGPFTLVYIPNYFKQIHIIIIYIIGLHTFYYLL